MRTLGFWLVLSLAGCVSIEPPAKPLTGADIVFLAKSGRTAPQIIEELRRTDTLLPLQASDIVSLHDAGVPGEVLDYLLRAKIKKTRGADPQQFMYGAPLHGGFGGFPWGPPRH